ncbi:MAG TPA: DUF2188 domain-containing protein [Patescibacteria group bacterium]|nr:DUF2188 domain-containing protein [Patescibacteria group bacterium]
MPNYHVTKNKDANTWNIKKGGAERVSGIADTQREAEQMAKQFCSNAGGGEVRIYGLDGKIRDSDTVKPGNDPCPPKDKKY